MTVCDQACGRRQTPANLCPMPSGPVCGLRQAEFAPRGAAAVLAATAVSA